MARRAKKPTLTEALANPPPSVAEALRPASAAVDVNALIERHNQLDVYKDQETKKFAEFMKPVSEEMEKIKDQILVILTRQNADNIRCDAGTAYISNLMSLKIDADAEPYKDGEGAEFRGTEALLYYALDHPDDMGIDALNIKPVMEKVKAHLDAHEGKPPPGVAVSWWRRVNIKKS